MKKRKEGLKGLRKRGREKATIVAQTFKAILGYIEWGQPRIHETLSLKRKQTNNHSIAKSLFQIIVTLPHLSEWCERRQETLCRIVLGFFSGKGRRARRNMYWPMSPDKSFSPLI